MKQLLHTLLLVVAGFSFASLPVPSSEKTAPSIESSAVFRTSVVGAKSLVVYEGLPHQMWESDALATELKRQKTVKVLDYPFYTPAVDAKNPEQLRKILASPTSVVVYGGPKACGGYHPDYCVCWQAEGTTYYALICFGCHEIILYDGKTSLIYDLAEDAFGSLKKLLSAHQDKRPKRATD